MSQSTAVVAQVGIPVDRQLAAEIIDAALSNGADFAELFVEDRVSYRLSYLDAKVKDCVTGQVAGAGVRVFYGTNAVYAYTTDLSREGLLACAKAVSRTRRGAAGLAGIALQASADGRPLPYRLHPSSVDRAHKVELLARADRAARAFSAEVAQVDVSLGESVQQVLVANSEGLYVQDVRPYSRFMVQAIARSGGEQQTGSEGPGALMGGEFLDDLQVECLAISAARSAVTMLKAGYAPGGKMPVVIDKGFGGVIFHEACGHLLEATSVAPGASIMAGKLGEPIASECVTAIDDGTIAGEWGSLSLDDEGMPTQKTTLIRNGVLESYMVDKLGGKKLGMAPTGCGRRESYQFAPTSRMRNTYIAPGPHELAEMIESIPYGLYARRMGGGSVSPGTGDFNFSVREAYLIRDGKLAEPVRGATLIGNGADVLMKISMVGQDLEFAAGMCGSVSGSIPVNVGQPPIKVSEIVVGGR